MSKMSPDQEKNYDSYPVGPNILHETAGDRELNVIAQKVAGIVDMCDTYGDAIDHSRMKVNVWWTVKPGNLMNKSDEHQETGCAITDVGTSVGRKRKVDVGEKTAGLPGGLE